MAVAAGVEPRIRYKTSPLAVSMIRNANSAVPLMQTFLRGRELGRAEKSKGYVAPEVEPWLGRCQTGCMQTRFEERICLARQ